MPLYVRAPRRTQGPPFIGCRRHELLPLLRERADRPLYAMRGHTYVACAACGSARLDPLPDDEPADLYGAGYFVGGEDRGGYVDYEADEAIHRRNADARLRLVASALPARGRDAVAVGCASGYVLDAYRDAGFVAHGVDVSPWARDRAAACGHDVHATLKARSRHRPTCASCRSSKCWSISPIRTRRSARPPRR